MSQNDTIFLPFEQASLEPDTIPEFWCRGCGSLCDFPLISTHSLPLRKVKNLQPDNWLHAA